MIHFFYVFIVGILLGVLCIFQIILYKIRQATRTLPRTIHRLSLVGSVFFIFGWGMKLYVPDLATSDNYRALESISSFFIDFTTMLIVILFFTVGDFLMRSNYSRSTTKPRRRASRKCIFGLTYSLLIVSCVAANITASVMDRYWPRSVFFVELTFSSLIGISILWHHFYNLRQCFAKKERATKSYISTPCLDTILCIPLYPLRKYYLLLVQWSILLVLAVIMVGYYHREIFSHLDTRMDESLSAVPQRTVDFLVSLLQWIAYCVGLWYGWISCRIDEDSDYATESSTNNAFRISSESDDSSSDIDSGYVSLDNNGYSNPALPKSSSYSYHYTYRPYPTTQSLNMDHEIR